MLWLLLIAGASVGLAFFLLMDVATAPARVSPVPGAAGGPGRRWR